MTARLEEALRALAPLGPVEPRRMFGGTGLFLDGRIFALEMRGEIFIKTDASSRARFDAAGCPPFTFERGGRTVITSYRRVPAGPGDGDDLREWARLGLAAAARAARS